jgi:hypothetical protein
MTEKDFDELIRKAASSNLTPDECFNWENMNIPIPKRKRRAPFFLFFFLGLGALGLLGGIYYFLEFSKAQTAQRISVSNEKYDLHILDSPIVVNDIDIGSKSGVSKDITHQDSKFESRSFNTRMKRSTLPATSELVAYTDSNLDVVTEESLTKGVTVSTKKNVTPDTNTGTQEIRSFKEIDYRMFDRFYFDSPLLSMSYLKPDRRLNYWFVKGGALTHKNLIGGNEFTDTKFGRNSSGLFITISKHHSLRRKWFLETGFTYSRLNHFYQGEQDLGYINDISVAERVSSRRIIKHNNLIEIAEIQLGLGRTIPLKENLWVVSSISVSPGLVTRRAGRVFLPNESTPISIEEATDGFPFSLSSELMLGLQYQVKEKVGIGLIAGYKYYFTSIPILSEKQRPNIMSIGLSVRKSIGG